MNKISRWLRIGGAMVLAVGAIAATYLGLSFWRYGSDVYRGPELPEWFTAGFEYAVDETPLRGPLLRVADWLGVRDWHEALSANRRIKAWFTRNIPPPMNVAEDGWYMCDPGGGWRESMHAYYASREASFFPSLLPTTRPTAEVDESHPLAFAKEWAELADRRPVRQAERRCQE